MPSGIEIGRERHSPAINIEISEEAVIEFFQRDLGHDTWGPRAELHVRDGQVIYEEAQND